MTYTLVGSGQTSSFLVANFGDTIFDNGGETRFTTVNDGGIEYTYFGGVSLEASINSGGVEDVSPGGLFEYGLIAGGGLVDVFLQGSALDAFLAPGGTLAVYGGGVTTGSIVEGTEAVNDDGLAVSAYVISGGTQIVGMSSAINPNSHSAVASGTVIEAGGSQTVLPDGVAISSHVLSGGQQNIDTDGAQGSPNATFAPIASNTVIEAGGEQTVTATVLGIIGSTTFLGLVGSSIDPTVYGTLDASDGGFIEAPLVENGGILRANDDLASDTTIMAPTVDSGGSIIVYGAQIIESAIVNSGGTIDMGAAIFLDGPGMLSDAIIHAGGDVTLSDAAADLQSVVVASNTELEGGVLTLSGVIQVANPANLDDQSPYYFQPASIDTVVTSGGTEQIDTLATANNTVLVSGVELISSGGTANGTVVSGGSYQEVLSGGTANGAVLSGGTATVSAGGLARDAAVSAGGRQIISGLAALTTVSAGGFEEVSSGGISEVASIGSGGTQIVFDGGTALGAVVGSGGTQVLSSGGNNGYTTLDAGGAIDLASLPYVPGGTVTSAFAPLGGTGLIITQDDQTVDLTLTGSYAGEHFHLSAAPSGLAGTMLTVDTSPLLTRASAPMRFITGDAAPAAAVRLPAVGANLSESVRDIMQASGRLEPSLGSVVGAHDTATVDELLQRAQSRLGTLAQDLPVARSAGLHALWPTQPPA